MTSQTKATKNVYRAAVLGLAALASGAGCSTMKMPFSKSPLASSPDPAAFAASVSNTGKGIGGQFKSMGTAVTSAVGKAKNAVTSTFTSRPGTSDPTSLANMPTNLGPEIWVANGHLYETQGNQAKALDNYTKALELEPTNMAALLSTARLYGKQGQHAQAANFFAKAIAINPDPATYNELALVQQNLGKMAEAQASVQKAIELDPANARYRNNLAGMLVAGGRSDEAVKQLEQVFPPAVANYNVAYLHFTNSNIAAAQQHLQIALQADPNLQPARDLLDKLGGNQSAQTAVAAYNTAGQIYRTAQAVAGSTANMSAPQSQNPQAAYPQTGYPQASGSYAPQTLMPPANQSYGGYPAAGQ